MIAQLCCHYHFKMVMIFDDLEYRGPHIRPTLQARFPSPVTSNPSAFIDERRLRHNWLPIDRVVLCVLKRWYYVTDEETRNIFVAYSSLANPIDTLYTISKAAVSAQFRDLKANGSRSEEWQWVFIYTPFNDPDGHWTGTKQDLVDTANGLGLRLIPREVEEFFRVLDPLRLTRHRKSKRGRLPNGLSSEPDTNPNDDAQVLTKRRSARPIQVTMDSRTPTRCKAPHLPTPPDSRDLVIHKWCDRSRSNSPCPDRSIKDNTRQVLPDRLPRKLLGGTHKFLSVKGGGLVFRFYDKNCKYAWERSRFQR
jgi:hypothetical protein